MYQHSSDSKKLSAGSIKTPALLFYQPQAVQEQRGLSRQDSGVSSGLSCENHPNKAARFATQSEEEDDPIYYCEKCAQRLAEQGFPIVSISELVGAESRRTEPFSGSISRKSSKKSLNCSKFPFPERQQEIETFLSTLEEVKEELDENTSQVKETLIGS
jgi:DNA-binding transcriptional MerR regulator